MRSIKSFIIGVAVLISLALFSGAYLFVSALYVDTVRRDAAADSRLFAKLTFNAMFEVMRLGWSRAQLDRFLEQNRAAFGDDPVTLELHRGPVVENLYGSVSRAPRHARVYEVLRDGVERASRDGDLLRILTPLTAREACLGCHHNARTGDVLGVIEVTHDLGARIAAARTRFVTALLPIVPVALLVALLLALFITRKLARSIARLHARIEGVRKMSDLEALASERLDLGFSEFDRLVVEIDQLARRLREIGVDRDLLEFEIRLLEKFVITSDVVRDWRDYVNKLLLEINHVIATYTLFSIFKVEDEKYELEVFWRGEPTARGRDTLEAIVRRTLAENRLFDDPAEVSIRHNVADGDYRLPEIGHQDLLIETKTLFVERPKIGGIVGIGVHSDLARDSTRLLVLESILSTLLNVVGSVKAIYKYTQDLEYYATRDPLTHLYNQRVFRELLDAEIGRAQRAGSKFALLVIDCDNFKEVNDRHGHTFGDQVLQQLAEAIRGALRRPDILARYGGDEFVAILPETGDGQPYTVGERVREAIGGLRMRTPDGEMLGITASIGLGIYPDHATGAKELFLFADEMMYQAKHEGKDRLRMPSSEDVLAVHKRIGEKGKVISRAIEERLVIPYFQPIAACADGTVHGYEVLSRIDLGGDGGLLGAGEFIAAAEQMGVIHQLDFIALDKAFAIAADSGFDGPLFFNLSPRNLAMKAFLAGIKRLCRRYSVAPQRLVLELREREMARNAQLLKRFFSDLKADGFRFAIDAFGSSFSSFQSLRQFPVDYLRIDGEYVTHMLDAPRERAYVQSIALLARQLDIVSIAGFIEDAATLRAVAECGVDLAQGFHVGRPGARPG